MRLSRKQRGILEFLARQPAGEWTTRPQMHEEVGAKGFSKAMGAPSKSDYPRPGTLSELGYVELESRDGRPLKYRITERGRDAV